MVVNMNGEKGDKNCIALTKQNELHVIDIIAYKKINSIKVPNSMQVLTNISLTIGNERILATGKKTPSIIDVDLSKISEGPNCITEI